MMESLLRYAVFADIGQYRRMERLGLRDPSSTSPLEHLCVRAALFASTTGFGAAALDTGLFYESVQATEMPGIGVGLAIGSAIGLVAEKAALQSHLRRCRGRAVATGVQLDEPLGDGAKGYLGSTPPDVE